MTYGKRDRLDVMMLGRGLAQTRSQAESFVRMGGVRVNGAVATKSGQLVGDNDRIALMVTEQYVSRAGLKLASVSVALGLNFKDKIVLDVGSSTGGFTDYALQHGALKVIAVDVGTDQLHPSLRGDERIELYEKTDIRDIYPRPKTKELADMQYREGMVWIDDVPDIVVIDVSFISLREILPHLRELVSHHTQIVAMVKPQFEAQHASVKHKGVIKNDRLRRDILMSFEQWTKQRFVIRKKSDSQVAGSKGNVERFYLLSLVGR